MSWTSVDMYELLPQLEINQLGGRMLSPYSIPEAYRLENEDHIATLEFRYMSPDSEIIKHALLDGVDVCIGVETGRIFRFDFDLRLFSSHNIGKTHSEKKCE